MTARDPMAGPARSRPTPLRPKEAPRPDRQAESGQGNGTLGLRPARFVDLSANQERLAVSALAELLVPLLTDSGRSPHVTPIGHTGDSATGSRVEPVYGES